MKKDLNVIYEKTDEEIIVETMEIINTVFGKKSDDGLNEYKRMSIYNVYSEYIIGEGMQKHQYEEVLAKLKPFILATEDLDTIEEYLREGTEIYKEQRWKAVNQKLEAFRQSKVLAR